MQTITPQQLAIGKETVAMLFPRRIQLNTGNQTIVVFERGVHQVPTELADHWWLKNNGVTKYSAPADSEQGEGEPLSNLTGIMLTPMASEEDLRQNILELERKFFSDHLARLKERLKETKKETRAARDRFTPIAKKHWHQESEINAARLHLQTEEAALARFDEDFKREQLPTDEEIAQYNVSRQKFVEKVEQRRQDLQKEEVAMGPLLRELREKRNRFEGLSNSINGLEMEIDRIAARLKGLTGRTLTQSDLNSWEPPIMQRPVPNVVSASPAARRIMARRGR